MGTWPKVSIVVINYNGYRDTIECLQSLREISYPNYDVIVVDNASTNESVKEIRDYVREGEILIPSKVNGGFSAGNNIGIKYALDHGADYCLLLNNDTVVEPAFLSALVDTAKKCQKQAVVTSKILYFYDQTKIWYAGGTFNHITSRTTHVGIDEKDMGQFNHTNEVSFISGCCMLLPSNVIRKIGLMDEDYFLYSEDLAYCCKITRCHFNLIYEPKSVIYHKVNSSTGKQSNLVAYYMVRNKLYIIRKYIKFPQRIIATIYNTLEVGKRIISNEYSLYAVMCAMKDYRNGVVGKTNRGL